MLDTRFNRDEFYIPDVFANNIPLIGSLMACMIRAVSNILHLGIEK